MISSFIEFKLLASLYSFLSDKSLTLCWTTSLSHNTNFVCELSTLVILHVIIIFFTLYMQNDNCGLVSKGYKCQYKWETLNPNVWSPTTYSLVCLNLQNIEEKQLLIRCSNQGNNLLII